MVSRPPSRAALGALALALVLPPCLAKAEQSPSYSALLTPLLKGGTDVLGRPLSYPPGQATVTAAVVVLAPGQPTGWHTHAVPLFAQVLEGELTVDYGSKGKKVFRAGDTVLEAVDWPHNGTNTGTVPVRLLAVYMGSDAAANATPADGPR
ncbi:cupin domain-containing protein [Nostoc sp. NIES-2111]